MDDQNVIIGNVCSALGMNGVRNAKDFAIIRQDTLERRLGKILKDRRLSDLGYISIYALWLQKRLTEITVPAPSWQILADDCVDFLARNKFCDDDVRNVFRDCGRRAEEQVDRSGAKRVRDRMATIDAQIRIHFKSKSQKRKAAYISSQKGDGPNARPSQDLRPHRNAGWRGKSVCQKLQLCD